MQSTTELAQKIKKLIVSEMLPHISQGDITPGTLEQLLRTTLQEAGQASYGALLTAMDEQRYDVEIACPEKGAGKRISRRKAKALSIFGWITYRRSYYRCSQGGYRIPLDEAEGLRPGEATPLMSSLLGLAGVTTSFEEAQRYIARVLQVRVSANTIRQETHRIGRRQQEEEKAMIRRSEDLEALQKREQGLVKRPKRRYGSIDGVFILTKEGWREVKVGAWYEAGPRYGQKELHAKNIAYYSSLEKAEEFGKLAWGTAVHHQVDQAEELIFVADGAAWIWKLVEQYFPQAVQIVDWYHAVEYLHHVAEVFPGDEAEREAWLEDTKTLLWEGEVERVLAKVEALPASLGRPREALLSYYRHNAQRMRYDEFREHNYLIGSGTIESACKQVATLRLKRPGAQWTETGAELTAKARSAWLSGTWSTLTGQPLAA